MSKSFKKIFSLFFTVLFGCTFFAPNNINALASIENLTWSYWYKLNNYDEYLAINEEKINQMAKEMLEYQTDTNLKKHFDEISGYMGDYFLDNYPTKMYLLDEYDPDYLEYYVKAYATAMFGSYNSGLSYMKETITEALTNFKQFNIYGGNGGNIKIGTSYMDYGYASFFMLDDKEVKVGADFAENYTSLDRIVVDENGITYDETGFGKLHIFAKNKDAKTVVVTYELTNNTGKDTTFKLATATDVQFGNNDYAAISKTDSSFDITQDDETFDTTYGASLHIALNPLPTTTWIGEYQEYTYYKYYVDYRYESSPKEYYTKDDDVDTALNYSWQGNIKAGETKTFTATFGLSSSEMIKLKFTNAKEETTVIETLGGGAFQTPPTTKSIELGYNTKWYKNGDESLASYYSNTWVIAPKKSTNYYEIKRKNDVIPYEGNESNYCKATVVKTTDLKEMFKDDAENSYDDVKIVLEVNELKSEIEDKEVFENSLSKDYVIGAYFDASLFKLINNADKTQIDSTDKLVKVKFTLPKELKVSNKKFKRDYQIIRVHEGVAEVIEAAYNEKENELIFETDKFSTYAIAYKEYKRPANENPNTADNSILYITLSLISLLVVLYEQKKLNKKFN